MTDKNVEEIATIDNLFEHYDGDYKCEEINTSVIGKELIE